MAAKMTMSTDPKRPMLYDLVPKSPDVNTTKKARRSFRRAF